MTEVVKRPICLTPHCDNPRTTSGRNKDGSFRYGRYCRGCYRRRRTGEIESPYSKPHDLPCMECKDDSCPTFAYPLLPDIPWMKDMAVAILCPTCYCKAEYGILGLDLSWLEDYRKQIEGRGYELPLFSPTRKKLVEDDEENDDKVEEYQLRSDLIMERRKNCRCD